MNDMIIELTEEQLLVLAWFGSWSPEVHRADWRNRRAWPPGFRYVRDLSASWSGSEEWQKAEKRLEVGPNPKHARRIAGQLLPWGLLEGASGCYRLTPRGRSALRLAGWACPSGFLSHCPEIFDNVPLTPVVMRQEWESNRQAGRPGEPLPDVEASWRRMLSEYQEANYRGRHTLVQARARLGRFSSTGTYFNGSIRRHYGGIMLEVEDSNGQRILEAAFSLEGFADLLSSDSHVPATLHYYVGHDGVGRSEPAPPPVSPTRRMLERLSSTETDQTAALESVIEKVEELIKSKRLGPKAGLEVVKQLRVIAENGNVNRAYVVEQAVNELSIAVESMATLALERVALEGGADGIRPLLGEEPLLLEE